MSPLLRIVLLVVLSIPQAAHAATFWDDELESGNTGYDFSVHVAAPSCGISYDTSLKVSGAASLKMEFPQTSYSCGANVGSYQDRSFSATADLWSRFYIRLSPGFVVSDVTTKIMLNITQQHLSNWWLMLFGNPNFAVTLQNYPTIGDGRNLTPNMGVDGSLRTSPEGQFVCIETRVKQNDVGQANGAVEAYKNGVQILNYPGLEMRKTSLGTQDSTFHLNRLYRQGGQGSIHYDRVAVGNTRIGCIGSGTVPPVPPAPAAPSGLRVVP